MKVGVIGYGSMGKMLLEKFWVNKSDNEFYLANRSFDKIANLAEKYCVCKSNQEIAALVDILFICVRPIDMKNVLEEIQNVLDKKTIIVSLNGSITFAQMETVCKNKLVKVIPSVLAEINKSQTLICYNELVNESDKKCVENLLKNIGSVIELPESEMGMGSELVSCMPGFIASLFNEICTSAQKHTSIQSDEIIQMVLNTMIATGQLMLEKNLSFQDVVSRVATKGGITEEGVNVIQDEFPKISDSIFDKTLEKRRLTTLNAKKVFL